jgi:hypothetical protein
VEKWWRVSWKRVAVALAIVFGSLGLIAGIGALLEYQLMPWILAHQIIRDNQHLSVVPVPLPDKSIATLNGLRIERFDFSFQVPWKKIEREQTSQTISYLAFKEGVSLLITNPSDALNSVKSFQEAAKIPHDADVIRQLFGSKALSSNYYLMAEELTATPSQVKWWTIRTENIRSFELLTHKSIEIRDSSSIYLLASEAMHGFQFGNPAVAPYKVELDLFDRNDQRYQIMISGKDEQHPFVSQPEINAIIASLRPIPHR